MSRHGTRTYVCAASAGALLALLAPVAGMVQGSAAHLEVDGGVLQQFTFDRPRADHLLQEPLVHELAEAPSGPSGSSESHVPDDLDEGSAELDEGQNRHEAKGEKDQASDADQGHSESGPPTGPASGVDGPSESAGVLGESIRESQGGLDAHPCPDDLGAEPGETCEGPR